MTEPDGWEEANETARAETAAAGLTPLCIAEIAEWFEVRPLTVRRQWIYERVLVRDPRSRFPLPTWPGSNPRWAQRVVKEWGIYTHRLHEDGTVNAKSPAVAEVKTPSVSKET